MRRGSEDLEGSNSFQGEWREEKRRQQIFKGGYRKLTANLLLITGIIRSLQRLIGDKVNFILTRPKSSPPRNK